MPLTSETSWAGWRLTKAQARRNHAAGHGSNHHDQCYLSELRTILGEGAHRLLTNPRWPTVARLGFNVVHHRAPLSLQPASEAGFVERVPGLGARKARRSERPFEAHRLPAF